MFAVEWFYSTKGVNSGARLLSLSNAWSCRAKYWKRLNLRFLCRHLSLVVDDYT